MKLGMRTPSPLKSIKARTTGGVKRAVKRSVNPMYGKKGVGVINNPKRAVHNKVYSKTTVGINGRTKSNSANKDVTANQAENVNYIKLCIMLGAAITGAILVYQGTWLLGSILLLVSGLISVAANNGVEKSAALIVGIGLIVTVIATFSDQGILKNAIILIAGVMQIISLSI
ncbi:MAG TPA: hypothetical protein VFF56_02020 [Bacillota bacterium]|mgnify:CR=1 FL=1|nr:hypothetical protein [Bacillota bacterium]